MVAPKIVSELKAELPQLKFDDGLLERMGQAGEGAVLENIVRQKQADESPLESNAPSTRDRKIKKGNLWRGRVMSLIDEKKRFIQGKGVSFRHRKADGNAVLIEPTEYNAGKEPSVKQLTEWLQQPGKNERRAYTGWFGLNKQARAAIRRMLRDWIDGEFVLAAKRLRPSRPEFKPRSR